MKHLSLLLGLLATPAAAQLCAPVYLRLPNTCPEGSTSAECVEWTQGPLTAAMLNSNFLNVARLCEAGVGPGFGVIDAPSGANPTATASSDTLVIACSGLACSGSGKTLTLTVSGAPPTGVAGGDLGGSYPSPTVNDDSHAHTAATLPAASTTGAGVVELATSAESTAGLAVQANDPRLIGPNSVTLGTDTVGGYAGSASEAGPAATALALNANPPPCPSGEYGNDTSVAGALICAQVQYSQLGGVPAPGAGGSVGVIDNRIVRADGTAGSTIQGSDVTLDDNQVVNPLNAYGVRIFHPGTFGSGASIYAVPNPIGGTSDDPSAGLFLYRSVVGFTDTANAENAHDTCLSRFSGGTLWVSNCSGAAGDLRVRSVVMIPASGPPFVCDALHEGARYADSSGPGTDCKCYFAAGDGWVNIGFPARIGSDCS